MLCWPRRRPAPCGASACHVPGRIGLRVSSTRRHRRDVAARQPSVWSFVPFGVVTKIDTANGRIAVLLSIATIGLVWCIAISVAIDDGWMDGRTDDVNASSDNQVISLHLQCLICVTGRACMQTFPCAHKVLCKKCFLLNLRVDSMPSIKT